jgi:hypothetical protein
LDRAHAGWRSDVNTILDIGAYQGIATGILRSQGFDATGYDPDPLEAGKSEDVVSEVSDIGNVDMLWMSHVLEHADSAISMLNTWKPYAKKAFIEVPPGNYQLPHILVFQMDSFKRTLVLTDINIDIIQPGIRAVVSWD